ncbi:RNA methyltransferase [Cytophagales bacterium LB-30]|uniref:RNA methyltransferase n=1 Tax=Shiella aurantiaca TaxID=3058365 RepID=A0ABT8F4I9_9BACT|nr:RNA methyltransferase [Shiella aurantiaca]MDN4165213.1 RNA methyltransferase [Shiella aurantiaca]
MLSKNQGKYIKSLQIKKYRKQEQKFLVEGAKSIQELLASSFEVDWLLMTEEFAQSLDAKAINRANSHFILSEKDLSALSSFENNNSGLAVVRCKPNQPLKIQNEYALVLDDVKDPGNLGTIIRIADWYGISKIICSENSAEFYNPKVISATMGSFTRVQLFYTDLIPFLSSAQLPIMGALLEGEVLHTFNFPKAGLLVMGNESNGISAEVRPFIQHALHIPGYGHAESLNVGVATAIFCDNIRRSLA